VKETKPKLTHGGRRPGAGRPPVDRVRKTYKLDPWVIAKIQKIHTVCFTSPPSLLVAISLVCSSRYTYT